MSIQHICNREKVESLHYFGSISAVYSILTAEEVGVRKSYLLHAGLSGNGTITTKTAIIKQATLIRSSRQRKEDLL
ncbi:hypothetical protein [Bacteroides zoogleoformans]|uniref:hypothetical protein n=1 Tax=Bacteroides zoogleoformans TaxID=28119 RepID=UPI00248EE29B|nr:hypothetical protein [Bacteroides zoogleoformans]